MRRRTSQQAALLRVLLALCVIASACGSASTLTPPENAAPLDPDGPQYGASLDEFLDAKRAERADEQDQAAAANRAGAATAGFEQIEWEDLTPPGFTEDEIYERFADRLNSVVDGSPEADLIFDEMQAEYDTNDAINADLDGESIRLAGFVAALNYEEELITEFLLVPYFGACIHVPPPPPNQTIMVTLADGEGLTFDESWGAIWVEGTLDVTSTTTDLATASYSISKADYGVHEET